MTKKVFNPFKKMTEKQKKQMIEVDVKSRNLIDKVDKKVIGNFLHLHTNKKAS